MIGYYILDYLLLAWKIFIRPWQSIDTLWIILPLILILVMIHIYFGRYPTEELSWSTAFSNSVSLLWVCIILFNYIFSRHSFAEIFADTALLESLAVVAVLTGWVLLLLVLNFYHVLPHKIMFFLSSFDSVYILAYIAISLVIGFYINKQVLISAGVLFVILTVLMQVIKGFVPKSAQAKKIEALREKKKKRKKAGKKAARTRKWNSFIEKIKGVFK